MNRNRCRSNHFLLTATSAVFVVFLLQLATGPLPATLARTLPVQTSETEFNIGDTVEFDFMGDTTKGTITSFFATGWPKVKFEYRNRAYEQLFPPDRLRLVEAKKPAAASGNVSRTWSDASGKFSVEAELISQSENQVKLKKADGRVVELTIDKLSADGQAYLEQLRKANSPDNPFAGGEPLSAEGDNSTIETGNVAVKKNLFRPNPRTKMISLQPTPWFATVDAATTVYHPDEAQIIPFPTSQSANSFHRLVSELVTDRDLRQALVTLNNPFEKTAEVVAIDLEKHRTVRLPTIDADSVSPFAISPDGSRVVTLRKGHGHAAGQLDFWNVENQTGQKLTTWETASFFNRDGFRPEQGVWLDNDRLLTCGNTVTLWDSATALPIYSFASDGPVALSPNAKWLAAAIESTIWIVNVADGQPAGTLDLGSARAQLLAISPSGKFLAALRFDNEISIWNLETGKRVRQMTIGPGGQRRIDWLSDAYLLINGRDLFDVDLSALVWQYHAQRGQIETLRDGRSFVMTKEKLIPIEFPLDELTDQTAHLKPETLQVFRPDVKICLQFEMPFSPEVIQQIKTHFTDQLNQHEVNVVPNAELQLLAEVTAGKKETVTISNLLDPLAGFPGHGEKVKLKPHTSTLTLRMGEQILWRKTQEHRLNGLIRRQGEETVEEAVERICGPDPDFFTESKLPQNLATLPNGKPLGSSNVTENGIE